MRIAVAGGGTAGHVWPVIATASALKDKDADLELLYLGGGTPEEGLAREAGLEFRRIKTGKMRRYGRWWYLDPGQILANLRDVSRVLIGVVQSALILGRWRPEVVFAKGGYAAFPVAIAASLLRIPIVIHESDRVMGLSNKILRRLASRVAVSVSGGSDPKETLTGNPIRPEILKAKQQDFFKGEGSGLPTVLVVGSHQGARVINEALWGALPELLRESRVIHITGVRDGAETEELARELPSEVRGRYFHPEFLTKEYGSALQAADLVVTRGGAGALAEAAACGKPMLIIPLPHAAGNHQMVNARHCEEQGAAVVLEQAELSSSRLSEIVMGLLHDRSRRALMAEKAMALGRPGAADKLAQLIMAVAQEKSD